jgi:hypothetical protein
MRTERTRDELCSHTGSKCSFASTSTSVGATTSLGGGARFLGAMIPGPQCTACSGASMGMHVWCALICVRSMIACVNALHAKVIIAQTRTKRRTITRHRCINSKCHVRNSYAILKLSCVWVRTSTCCVRNPCGRCILCLYTV